MVFTERGPNHYFLPKSVRRSKCQIDSKRITKLYPKANTAENAHINPCHEDSRL